MIGLSLSACLQAGAGAQGHVDFWDRAPLNYSDTKATDKLALLSKGEMEVPPGDALTRLRYVLNVLDVPADSQVLVFSKTSLQNDLINPGNPRALYFSENAYVGYVPGGAIEAVVQDPVLGPVFYFVGTDRKGGLEIQRDTNNCMSCHATARTENVPGLLIRSVFADEAGHPLLHLGTTDVTDQTPIAERWGGWYVTGRSAMPHLGNRTFTEDGGSHPDRAEMDDLRSEIDVTRYLRPTSDIVALLVLEHQCRMHTLLNAASMNYRRSRHFSGIIDPSADPDKGSAGSVAESWAEKITDCMFFKDEADLGEGVEGNAAFQNALIARYPQTAKGESLADFRLYGRIFKRRCSFMIYSDAFRSLPPTVKSLVLAKMRVALAGGDQRIDWLAASERKRIAAILEETLPDWKP
ncbi:hypothetical protein HZ994_03130 [Akkermansiaceae bacterium]|nr:hypothetical protein HZ994_03130 [Akkermansiaceae bacterium]